MFWSFCLKLKLPLDNYKFTFRMNLTTLTPAADVNGTSRFQSGIAEDIMAVAEKMHWITSSFAGTVFLILGFVGNILSLLIWSKKAKKSSTELYLIAQAINDIGVLIFFFLTDSLIMIQPAFKESYAYGVFYSYVGFPIFYFFIVNSIWTLVGVTVDRYINVCWYKQAKVSGMGHWNTECHFMEFSLKAHLTNLLQISPPN